MGHQNVPDSIALYKYVDGLKTHIRKDVLLAQPTNVSEDMMAAERSEVAHNYSSVNKSGMPLYRAAFNQRQNRPNMPQNRPTQRTFHPREYGNPNTVPMELGYAQSSSFTPNRPSP